MLLKTAPSSALPTELLNMADLLDVAAKSGSGTTVLMQEAPTVNSPTINNAQTQEVATAAAIGADQGGAVALAGAIIYDVTGADGAKGAALPAAVAGLNIRVYNNSASALLLYPASGDDINDGTVNVSISVPGNTMVDCMALDATTWAVGNFVTLSGTQTLAGKTLTTPTISGAPVQATSHASSGQNRFVEISLTAAEIKALRATPKSLVAAEAGKTHIVVSGGIFLDYGTAAFAEDAGGSNLAVRYENGSGAKASEDIEATGFVDLTGDAFTSIEGKKDSIVLKAVCENKALVLHNIGAGEIVTGDSVARLKLNYVTFSTGW